MTEHWFGGDLASFAIGASPGAIVTAWNSQVGGLQHTELADGDGNVVDHVVVSDGTNGYPAGAIPRFKGPTLTLWVSVAGGPRALMVSTDLPALLDRMWQAATGARDAARASASKASEMVAGSSLRGHAADTDPHPRYHNDVRGDARYVRSAPPPMAPLTEPLEVVDFTETPTSADADMRQVWVTHNAVRRLVSWFNELGYYRAEQVPGALYEALATVVTSWRGTGQAYLVQQRGEDNVRRDVGGFDVDGRPITSWRPWVDITTIDPNVTGRYTEDASAGLSPLQVRWDTDDVMRIRGRISVSSAGTGSGQVVMVLPDGYWPATAKLLAIATSTGIACPCEVMPTGEVILRSTQAGPLSLSFDDLTISQ